MNQFKVHLKSLVPVTHTCNLSYSEGRDQEDCGSKPAPANSSVKPFAKTGLVEWLKVKALSSSPSIAKRKKKIKDISQAK
jgi:hypothetical protein